MRVGIPQADSARLPLAAREVLHSLLLVRPGPQGKRGRCRQRESSEVGLRISPRAAHISLFSDSLSVGVGGSCRT
jgi:hypothetical protein